MKTIIQLKKGHIEWKHLLLAMIFTIGCLVRLLSLDQNPMGLHQDEAYSAYNAWAIMNYGVDSYGYERPVYYTVWGSGMSVLYSYLTMPFLAIMDISAWAIRLPQAILGCLSIWIIYGLGKELRNKDIGVLFAGMLAINPWHIQQSRFGLDANLAVPMFLCSMYFLVRYLNGKKGSIWAAAVFMGLTLYCYALTWLLVPMVLILTLIFFRKRICFNRSLIGAMIILFLFALPLLLFLAVNLGLIQEIRTPFFSIPRLPSLRTGEMQFTLSALKARFLWLAAMLWSQHDDMWWISNDVVGSYYYISTPFIILGMLYHVKVLSECIRQKKKLPVHFIIALWFLAAFLIGCSIDLAKFHKVNFIHIPIILYGAMGLKWMWVLLKKWKYVPVICIICYLAAFGYYLYSQASFGTPYEEYGNSHKSHMHWNQYEEAIDRALELTQGNISIINLNHANVMLHTKISPREYLEQVVYKGDNKAFQTVSSIGRFYFDVMPGSDMEIKVYVFPYNIEETFMKMGYVTEHVTKCYGIAYERIES